MAELIDFAEPIEVLFLDGGRVRLVQSLPGKCAVMLTTPRGWIEPCRHLALTRRETDDRMICDQCGKEFGFAGVVELPDG